MCIVYISQMTILMLVNGLFFTLADFVEAACFFLLAILASYSGNAIWGKKADLQHGGGNT